METIWESVNLPRWGLKQKYVIVSNVTDICVNLPRWGLKLGWVFVISVAVNV